MGVNGGHKRMVLLFPFLVMAVIALQGCSNQSTLGDLTTTAAAPQTTAPAPQKTMIIVAKVALSPLIGPPQNVVSQMTRNLDVAATTSQLALLTDADAVGDYRLKGYLVATRSAKGVELSYIWDVFNNRGKRIDRSTGSEVIAGPVSGRNLWSIITPQTYQKIADRGIATVVKHIPIKPVIPQTPSAPKVGLR